MTRPCVIFDADDTLWKTQELYDAAIEKFMRIMYCQGFNPREARDTMMEDNMRRAKKYGVLPENFANAMIETYDNFCQGLGTYYSKEIADQIRAIGIEPHIGPIILYNGTRYTLETLRKRGYKLILCTAGVADIQLKKLEKSGLSDFFDRVYVVLNKTHEVFNSIIDENELTKFYTYMVGNSIHSDVNPSTTAEIRCFWLNQGTWSFDDEPMACPWCVYRIQDITDVLSYLRAV